MYKGWNEFPFSFRPLTVFVKYIYADTHTLLPKMFPFTLIVLHILLSISFSNERHTQLSNYPWNEGHT